ncbi:MAG: hypothetical protein D6677_09145 [Calditrichaeota bacterium]|nr:MAG: hypothetical protein D6677_09145 [Calditrichota bacterium]
MQIDGEHFVGIFFFISVATVIYYMIRFRYKERMAVIGKENLSQTQLDYLVNRRGGTLVPVSVKISVVAIGVGLALLIGNLLGPAFEDSFTVGLSFLLPGVGLLLLYYFVERKEESAGE